MTQILVAEDSALTREMLSVHLRSCGYEVLEAENGEQAWEIFRQNNVRFIIADWVMPVMSGIDLCRRVRERQVDGYVYFVLLTGKDTAHDIVEGLKAGADDYIKKPFYGEELKVRLTVGERILDLEQELVEKNDKLQVLNVQLERMARVDVLMDLGNRRSFYETIRRYHHRACREAFPYAIILCDVDNFKAYNDLYGHLAGDQVLKTVADTIKDSLRLYDNIFRYGGEEIVIILQEQDPELALAVSERLRCDVQAQAVEHKGSDHGLLTISAGVAVFDPARADEGWQAVVERADKALYRAKSKGRNQSCLDRSPPGQSD
jgi:diguanylate cyclase (GGDEF)-like protein